MGDLLLGEFRYHDFLARLTCSKGEEIFTVSIDDGERKESKFRELGPARADFESKCQNLILATSRSMVSGYMQSRAATEAA